MSTARAVRATVGQPAHAAPSRRSSPQGTSDRRPQLRVVDPRVRPARRRLVAVVGLLAALALFGSLLGLAVFHTFLVESQLELDHIDGQIEEADAATGQLRLEVAELRAPDRIRQVAVADLGMVAPPQIIMLTPASPDIPADPVGVLAEAPESESSSEIERASAGE
jgi:cell division protein FtsL